MLPRLQEMVLLKVFTLGPRCKIADIQDTLSQEIGEEQAWNTIHTTVQRLIDQGNVTWEYEDQKPNRQRHKKLYSMTLRGRDELMQSLRTTRVVYGAFLTDPAGVDHLFDGGPRGHAPTLA